jgi:hypothetical protein
MIQSFLKTFWRSMMRHKAHTFINLGGLVVGLICTLVLCVYIFQELSFDKHHRKAARIYRITEELRSDKAEELSASVPHPTGPRIPAPDRKCRPVFSFFYFYLSGIQTSLVQRTKGFLHRPRCVSGV